MNMNDNLSRPEKSPFAVLALNFFLPGGGYVYAGMYAYAMLTVVLFVVSVNIYMPIAVLIWLFGIVDGPLAVNRRQTRGNNYFM